MGYETLISQYYYENDERENRNEKGKKKMISDLQNEDMTGGGEATGIQSQHSILGEGGRANINNSFKKVSRVKTYDVI